MTSKIIRISLPGAGGRMGGMIVSEIAKADELSLVVATDRVGSPHIGLMPVCWRVSARQMC